MCELADRVPVDGFPELGGTLLAHYLSDVLEDFIGKLAGTLCEMVESPVYFDLEGLQQEGLH